MDFARDQALSKGLTQTSSSRLSKNLINDGDLVIIYERHDSLDHFYVKKGEILQNRFGKFYHDDIIGKPFGSMIKSFYDDGYMYVLRPTPELWCSAVRTRTQIINELDSSMIIFQLDIFPGCIVVESGTGSGAMTCALARTVSPHGRVHTFEYNAVRAETAKQEFHLLGVDHIVGVTCHDVCGKLVPGSAGFPGVAPNSADAVMLDLPEPWHAIGPARRVLKEGRNICSYSPCIEQCIRTFEALRREGFHSIRMLEVRQRPFDGRRIEIEQLDVGLPTGPDGGGGAEVIITAQSSANGGSGDSKAEINSNSNSNSNSSSNSSSSSGGNLPKYVPVKQPLRSLDVARPVGSMKGHTAFLTFAVKSESDADGDFGAGAAAPGEGDIEGDAELDDEDAAAAGGRRSGGGGGGNGDGRDAEFERSRERTGKRR